MALSPDGSMVVICSSTLHPELKRLVGLYCCMSEVQPWADAACWNYINKLKAFMDTGTPAADTSFIDDVSGVVNRGCAALSCAAGAVDGAAGRRTNARTVLRAMGLVSA